MFNYLVLTNEGWMPITAMTIGDAIIIYVIAKILWR